MSIYELSARLYHPDKSERHSGTAWMVDNDYALTAFHCVTKDGLKKPFPEDTEFRLIFDSNLTLSAVVEQQDAEIDAALLRILDSPVRTEGKLQFNNLPSLSTWAQYRQTNPGQCNWSSYGYPAGQVQGMHIDGMVDLPEVLFDHTTAIQLTCAQGGLGGLEGMSGAAVVNGNYVVGIIRYAPPAFQQKVVHATSIKNIGSKLEKMAQIVERNIDSAVARAAVNFLGDANEHNGTGAGAQAMGRRSGAERESTRILGRDNDIHAIKRMLHRGVRLLTLAGSKGVGKTRLALAIGEQSTKQYNDVFYVDAAAVIGPLGILTEIAGAMKLKEAHSHLLEESVTVEINERKVLLLVDGPRQLDDARELFDQLLTKCHGLHIIITCEQRLGRPRESVYYVRPLALPKPNSNSNPNPASDDATLCTLPIVRLFVQRARAANRDFTLDASNIKSVSQLCGTLGGLPLATEIIAAHSSAILNDDGPLLKLRMGLEAVHDKPEPERLDAVIALVAAALDKDTQTLLWRLSVFSGNCSAGGAEAMLDGAAGSKRAVLEQLDLLVNHGLLTASHQSVGRINYRLQSSVQTYCRKRLEESGELACAQRRHAAYYAQLAEKADLRLTQLSSSEAQDWLELLELEYTNLRAALRWSHRFATPCAQKAPGPTSDDDLGNLELGLGIAGHLFWFWNLRGSLDEGLRLTDMLLTPGASRSANLALALYCSGGLAFLQGAFPQARKNLSESAAIWRQLGNGRRLGFTLVILGMVALHQNDPDEAERFERESVALFKQVDDMPGLALALNDLANVVFESGKVSDAQSYYLQSLFLWRQVENSWGLGLTTSNLGHLAAMSTITTLRGSGCSSRWKFRARAVISGDMGNRSNSWDTCCWPKRTTSGLRECSMTAWFCTAALGASSWLPIASTVWPKWRSACTTRWRRRICSVRQCIFDANATSACRQRNKLRSTPIWRKRAGRPPRTC